MPQGEAADGRAGGGGGEEIEELDGMRGVDALTQHVSAVARTSSGAGRDVDGCYRQQHADEHRCRRRKRAQRHVHGDGEGE